MPFFHKQSFYFSEGDTDGEEHSEVFYYSSVAQLEELMSCLDGDDLEADLVRVLNEQRLDVERQVATFYQRNQ